MASLRVRYPLRYATNAEYAQLLVNGYHAHAARSYYAPHGHRAVVYPTGDVFISSESFGTDHRIGTIAGGQFVATGSAASELVISQRPTFDVSHLNEGLAGDEQYPVALSVSYKITVAI